MTYTLQRLQEDVMARLGENPRPQPSYAGVGIPSPGDIIRDKTTSLLPAVGGRLIMEAPAGLLGSGAEMEGDVSMRLMPCGQYAADVALPEGFLRLVSVKMREWLMGAQRIIMPDDSEWSRQWSEESGIAGDRFRPKAYLVDEGDGRVLRMIGSGACDDSVEWLRGWIVPEADDEGHFSFPQELYGGLVAEIAGLISDF